MKKFNSITKEILEEKTPSENEMEEISKEVSIFMSKLKSEIKLQKVDAEIFIGGSYAKKTMIKKDHYDIDIFVRFKKEDEKASALTEKLLKKFGVVMRIHGSRDYFKVKVREDLFFEMIPVKKIKNQKHARNITDLSYSHVKYINKKVKSKKLLDEIRLAKIFCYANNCYGAESYIKGFSGYSLELLVYHYKSFLKFAREIAKAKDKIIIDLEKSYKNKREIMMDLNSAKLQSPVVLIDPTYKGRNAAAALSSETFETFQESCRKFIKNPKKEFFELKKTDLDQVKKNATADNLDFILLEANTDKQSGDIAGSKLLKFFKHLEEEISVIFEIKEKGFNYNKNQSARFFIVAKSKEKIILNGPRVDDAKNVIEFRKKHKNIFTREGRVQAREKVEGNLKVFLNKWMKKNNEKIKAMGITKLKIIK